MRGCGFQDVGGCGVLGAADFPGCEMRIEGFEFRVSDLGFEVSARRPVWNPSDAAGGVKVRLHSAKAPSQWGRCSGIEALVLGVWVVSPIWVVSPST